MRRAMLERVLVNQAIEVAREFAGYFGWASGAGAIGEALSIQISLELVKVSSWDSLTRQRGAG
jgi:hypothetical protein